MRNSLPPIYIVRQLRMSDSPPTRILSWGLILAGLFLCGLPLYSFLFTREMVKPDSKHFPQEHTIVSDDPYGEVHVITYETMYVSPWLPMIGGFLTLIGALLITRARHTPVATSIPQCKNAEQIDGPNGDR